ncbi:ATP-grasp domain-containing protein [Candidatus Falkowbacteria bacterium]|jgi:cyanophycin synthetase|nr:ATP-grasp domain-containing protein [Candidatus Falkowbacteria bacterium]MBT7007023.1 ATP-grasp domain-containing protein [Candidatus Falkowbacteria bacterium]
MNKRVSPYLRIFINAAAFYGIRLQKSDCLHKVFNEKESHHFNYSATELNTRIGRDIAKDKFLSTNVLSHFGFPVVENELVTCFDDCLAFYKKYKNVVVKPLSGSMGKGITVGVMSQKELRRAYSLAKNSSSSQQVLVEKFIEGDDYRITVIDNKELFVSQRVPAHIVGTGKKSIKKLIEEKNANKRDNQQAIEFNKELLNLLKVQKVNLQTCLGEGKTIRLKTVANISTGGMSIDVTDKISKHFARKAIEISKALHLKTIGIDLITTDITGRKGKVIEINTRPQLLSHHYPDIGRKRYPARTILQMLFNYKLKQKKYVKTRTI